MVDMVRFADGRIGSVETRLAAGANTTVHRGKQCALLVADECEDNLDILNALIQHGADVNSPG